MLVEFHLNWNLILKFVQLLNFANMQYKYLEKLAIVIGHET